LGANSYTNFYEVDVVTTLARFFVGRGIYDAEKVTIIAMYKAQVDMIEKVSEDDIPSSSVYHLVEGEIIN